MKKIIALAYLLASSTYLAAEAPTTKPCAWYDREVTVTPKILAHHWQQTAGQAEKIIKALAARGDLNQSNIGNPEFHINGIELIAAYEEGYANGTACLDEAQKKDAEKVTKGEKIIVAALIERFSACIGNGSCKSCEKDMIKYAGALHKVMGLPHLKDASGKEFPSCEEERRANVEHALAYIFSHFIPLKK